MVIVVIVGDVGAIFACVAAGQAISGFATPLYNKIYVAVRIMRMVMIMTKPNITMFCMLDFKYATIKHSYGDTPLQQDIRRGGDDEDGDDNDKTMLGFLIPLCSLLPCTPLEL